VGVVAKDGFPRWPNCRLLTKKRLGFQITWVKKGSMRREQGTMSKVTIQSVSTRKQRKQFLNLPWQLYRHDPNWVPPLRFDQAEMVGYHKHPFYARNRIQTFLAIKDGEVVGRIAAIDNQDHVEAKDEQLGFWGFFESTNNQHVADALLDAARSWLSERNLPIMRGPANPSLNHTTGMLIDGFDSPPTFMMTYNPPYYPRLIEQAGGEKAQDLFAYWANIDMLPASSAKHGPIADEIAERYNVVCRPMNRKKFREEVELFLHVYNRSMVNHWGFAPMSDREIGKMAAGMQHLLIPELAIVAEIDDKPIGVVLCLPDFNPLIKKIDGRLLPFGVFRLLWAKRQIRKVRIMAANVVPEYQMLGVGLVMLRALVPYGLRYGLKEVEYSWIAESNRLSRGSLEKGGAKLIKTYRVYDFD
jgi:GNAT superfamily N-acetyltransferase